MPEPIVIIDPVEVPPSEDNGNVPLETLETPTEAPKEEPTPEVKPDAEPTPPVEPVVEAELFELPDGRKVDASTLSKEWKENFYPEYTRKSQELATLKPTTTPETEKPSRDENWVPGSYNELIQIAKEEAKLEIQREKDAEAQSIKQIEEAVTGQLTEIKTKDPTLNENALFLHATKYGFRDLRLAHQNMKDMAEAIKTTKQTTAKDVAKRQDPVSSKPGATGTRPDPSQFENARDYLRSLG